MQTSRKETCYFDVGAEKAIIQFAILSDQHETFKYYCAPFLVYVRNVWQLIFVGDFSYLCNFSTLGELLSTVHRRVPLRFRGFFLEVFCI